jgi:hypothetical protein
MIKHGHQIKVLMMLNKLSAQGRWLELRTGLKIFNKILTRHYIDHYWKFVFQVASCKFPHSIDTIPQFIEYQTIFYSVFLQFLGSLNFPTLNYQYFF